MRNCRELACRLRTHPGKRLSKARPAKVATHSNRFRSSSERGAQDGEIRGHEMHVTGSAGHPGS